MKPALMTLHFSICVEFALEDKQEGDWRDLKMPWFDMELDRHYKDYELGILLNQVVTMARQLAFQEPGEAGSLPDMPAEARAALQSLEQKALL